jgi:hypothetical protein
MAGVGLAAGKGLQPEQGDSGSGNETNILLAVQQAAVEGLVNSALATSGRL